MTKLLTFSVVARAEQNPRDQDKKQVTYSAQNSEAHEAEPTEPVAKA